MRRRRSSRIVENTWKCVHCDTVNRGRNIVCVTCSHPKGDDDKYVIPDEKDRTTVTNPEHLAMARAGRNWKCKYCGSHVRNSHGDCVNGCGAPREEPPEMRDSPPKQKSSVPRRRSSAPTQSRSRQPRPSDYWDDTSSYRPGMSNVQKVLLGLGGIALITGIVCLCIFLFAKHEDTAVVQSISWQYTVNLEQRETRHGEGWEMNAPYGAFDKRCRSKFYGTEDCNPYDCNPHDEPYDCNPYDCNCQEKCEDLGNGFSSCDDYCSTCYETCYETVYDTCYEQCDVYENWCTYSYYEWPVIATQTTNGTDHEVHWPNLKADPALHQRLKKREQYEVIFVGSKNTWTLEPSNLGEFKLYSTDDRWLVDYNRAGKVWPKQKLDHSNLTGFLALPWLN
jgi:hypothetical protein